MLWVRKGHGGHVTREPDRVSVTSSFPVSLAPSLCQHPYSVLEGRPARTHALPGAGAEGCPWGAAGLLTYRVSLSAPPPPPGPAPLSRPSLPPQAVRAAAGVRCPGLAHVAVHPLPAAALAGVLERAERQAERPSCPQTASQTHQEGIW